MLPLQLLVDAVQALDPALDLRGNSSLFQFVVEYLFHAPQESFSRLASRFYSFFHLLVGNRVNVTEAEVLQFATNLAHAQPVGDGGINIQCLPGDLLLPLGLQM